MLFCGLCAYSQLSIELHWRVHCCLSRPFVDSNAVGSNAVDSDVIASGNGCCNLCFCFSSGRGTTAHWPGASQVLTPRRGRITSCSNSQSTTTPTGNTHSILINSSLRLMLRL